MNAKCTQMNTAVQLNLATQDYCKLSSNPSDQKD
jgi:hypothetical protein